MTEFDAFAGAGGRPTQAERRLIQACAQSGIANCEDLADDERIVSADLVLALAIGIFRHHEWPEWALAATGLRVSGIHILEPVNLESRQVPADLLFSGCRFEGGIDLDNASLEGRLHLGHCTIRGSLRLVSATVRRQVEATQATFDNAEGDAIVAHGATTGTWFLDGATVRGGLNLGDARINGHFIANGASFERTAGNAIFAPGVSSSSWFLNNAVIEGGLILTRAILDGHFSAIGAHFRNAKATAIYAEGITSGPWTLNDAVVLGEVDLDGARLSGALLAASARFETPGATALRASRIEAASLDLDNTSFTGRCYIQGAHLDQQFSANGATFENPGGVAVCAQDASVSGWFMDAAVVRGVFDINNAAIDGQFNANRSTFENPGGLAIWAQGVSASCWNITATTVLGVFDINRGTIQGPFAGAQARLQAPGGNAFVGQEVRVQSFLVDGISVRGRFDLNHACIEGQFSASDATFDNAGSVAISAFSIRSRDWLISDSLIHGALDVSGGEFAGAFGGEHTTIRFPGGTAIDGQSARFQGGVYLRAGTEVSGGVDFAGARIGLVLDLSGSVWKAARYRAVRLQEATIVGEVVFRNAVLHGHLHANRARIESRMDFRGCNIVAATVARARGELPDELGEAVNAADEERQDRFRHHAIVLHEARIDGRLVMPDRCPEGIIDLSRATCDTLEDSVSGWPPPLNPRADVCETRICVPAAAGERTDIQHLVLDGFQYQHFEYPAGSSDGSQDVATARSNWLAGQSVEELRAQFNPQPWRQAATVLRSMGYDEAAQDLSIQRRVRQRFSASTPRRERIVSWLLHRVADYGFNPWKTVGISVACVLVFALVYSGLTRLCGGYGIWSEVEGACGKAPIMVAVQYGSVDPAIANRAYPTFDPVLYSLDMFVPIMDLGSEAFWRSNTRAHALVWGAQLPVGWVFTVLVVLERFLGAILIAIAVTGFTGLLTRDEK
jgi:hypothetical protein